MQFTAFSRIRFYLIFMHFRPFVTNLKAFCNIIILDKIFYNLFINSTSSRVDLSTIIYGKQWIARLSRVLERTFLKRNVFCHFFDWWFVYNDHHIGLLLHNNYYITTLNNDHLSTTATILGSEGWSLKTGLTVLFLRFLFQILIVWLIKFKYHRMDQCFLAGLSQHINLPWNYFRCAAKSRNTQETM